ncbi:MAG: hypothetical protein FWD75_03285 [Propionibacteriaceae bacterium]|nr:hypothetical protein [Propionibacteriaceae bacterium]
MTTREVTSNALSFLSGSALEGPIGDCVADSLGEYADDYDVAAIERDFRDAIQGILPDGWQLCGDFIYADVDAVITDEEYEDLRDKYSCIDLDGIIEAHEVRRLYATISAGDDGLFGLDVWLNGNDSPEWTLPGVIASSLEDAGEDATLERAGVVLRDAGFVVIDGCWSQGPFDGRYDRTLWMVRVARVDDGE